MLEKCKHQPISWNTQKTSLIDLTDAEGKSALHHAIFANHVRCVRILLDFGADINLSDKEGISPLILAQKLNRSDALQELKKQSQT